MLISIAPAADATTTALDPGADRAPCGAPGTEMTSTVPIDAATGRTVAVGAVRLSALPTYRSAYRPGLTSNRISRTGSPDTGAPTGSRKA